MKQIYFTAIKSRRVKVENVGNGQASKLHHGSNINKIDSN